MSASGSDCLISLRKTATELERLETLQASLAECYRQAIQACGQYAIVLDAGDGSRFRARLRELADSGELAESCAGARETQADFRAALADYRDRTQERVEQMRSEIEAGAAALAELVGDLASSGEDHCGTIHRELDRLRTISGWEDLADVRRGMQRVLSGITEAVTQMEYTHQMTVAQLRDEIRTLHQRMESPRRAEERDAGTGAWTRDKTEQRLRHLLEQNEAFWVVLVGVVNYSRLQSRYAEEVVEGTLKAVMAGLRELAGPDAGVGRWSGGEFLVVMDVDPSAAMAVAREAPSRLSTSYMVSGTLASMRVPLEIATGTVERAAGTGSGLFFRKLDQLSAALGAKS
jgi:GGDEF domain-containing protein